MPEKESTNRMPMRFSMYELKRIVVAILANITNRKFLMNVRELFRIFTKESYRNDADKALMVYVIERLVEFAIGNGIEDKDALLNMISFDGRYSNGATNVLNELYAEEMPEAESNMIDRKISQNLKLSVISEKSDRLVDIVNGIRSGDYEDLGHEISDVEDCVNEIDRGMKNYREAVEEANNTLSFGDGNFISQLTKFINEQKDPSTSVKTGVKMLNGILGGGFQAGRVYCCLAPMKNWKSGFLLNCALWAKQSQYNHLKAKDPNKRPVILYITLENTLRETTERIFSHCMGNNYRMWEHTPQENVMVLKQCDLYNGDSKNEPRLDIMYKPNKSITVADIDAIMDDYQKNGEEVVFLAVDYIKRIRPQIISKDLRIDLGGIADDFHVLAVKRDIPIVTAMQVNRSAISTIEQAGSTEARLDAFSRIGVSNVGESIDIPQNVDYCFTMMRTVDTKVSEGGQIESTDKFISFKVVASRYNIGNIDSFTHRFVDGNDMRLVEDANSDVSTSIISSVEFIQRKAAASGIRTVGARHP
jgi:replicative DNA helicase